MSTSFIEEFSEFNSDRSKLSKCLLSLTTAKLQQILKPVVMHHKFCDNGVMDIQSCICGCVTQSFDVQ